MDTRSMQVHEENELTEVKILNPMLHIDMKKMVNRIYCNLSLCQLYSELSHD